jgi:aminopeptidase N
MKQYILAFIALGILYSFQVLGQDIDVMHYQAEIDFDLTAETLTATAELHIRNVDTADVFYLPLHLYQLTVDKVTQGGTSLHFDHIGSGLTIRLKDSIPVGDSTTVIIDYQGHAFAEPGPSSWGGCFWNMNNTTFCMGVGFYAPWVSMMRHWLPSRDVPNDKATFDVTFIVPDDKVVAAAGLLHSVDYDNGKASYRWIENHQTASYLFNYAISDYVHISDSWNGIPLDYYVRAKDSLKGTSFFNTVPGMLEAFTQNFGPYPFDKVGYCITPIGAMEHQTMISYPQQSFDMFSNAGSTAAHELAHQWWGDWVTPADFRHAWLSEGFAVFAEAVYLQHLAGRNAYVGHAAAMGRSYKSSVAPLEGVFPLYDYPRDSPSSNYPQTIYKKGGAVLVMLREVMGEDSFFEGLKAYGQKFAYGNASTDDFMAVMEEHYGNSLDWFFDEWVYKAGWPEYAFEVIFDEGHPLRLRIDQNQDQSAVPLFKMPIPMFIVTRSLDTIRMTVMNEALETQEFEFPAYLSDSVRFLRIDTERLILSRQSFTTVNYSDPATPEQFKLMPSYPNPVQSGQSVVLPFSVEGSTLITLALFDSLGKNIKTMDVQSYEPGKNQIQLPTDSLPAGNYWIQMSSKTKTLVQALIIE